MRVVNNIIKPIANGFVTVADSSSHRADVARRASHIYDAGAVRTRIAEGSGYISGAVKPVVDGLSSCSDSIGVISDAIHKVSRKMRVCKNRTKQENPNASALKANIRGLKQSAPEIKEALNEVMGVNDVRVAKQEKGVIAGVKETGKAVTRVALSGLLYAAGSFIPVPGTGLAGYILGEKVANTVLGKPYTKIAKNIAKAK